MPARWMLLGMIAVASSAIHVDLAQAQAAKPGNAEKLIRVTYPIADLIVPVEDHSVFEEHQLRKNAPARTVDNNAGELTRLIRQAVSPRSWEEQGGPASIQFFPQGMSLVIRQPKEIHEEIAHLLTALRKCSEVQIAVQMRFFEVSSATAGRLRKAMAKHGQPARNQEHPLLDDKQFLEMAQLVQADSTIVQPPKITLLRDQKLGVKAASTRFDVRGEVSPDRRTVRLFVEFEHALQRQQSGPRMLRTSDTFTIPVERTLIWNAGSIGGTHVFVAVTPRLVIMEEDETILGVFAPKAGR